MHVRPASVGSHFALPVELPWHARQPLQAHACSISLDRLTHGLSYLMLLALVGSIPSAFLEAMCNDSWHRIRIFDSNV